MAFKAILEHWNCFPVILVDGLTEDEAIEKESEYKRGFIFECGYPIMDGEDALRTMACKEAKERLRKNDPSYREGRPRKDVQYELLPSETISAACERLGISRTQWYRATREAAS